MNRRKSHYEPARLPLHQKLTTAIVLSASRQRAHCGLRQNCQEASRKTEVISPQNKSLRRQIHRKKLAGFSSGLGILKIGGEKTVLRPSASCQRPPRAAFRVSARRPSVLSSLPNHRAPQAVEGSAGSFALPTRSPMNHSQASTRHTRSRMNHEHASASDPSSIICLRDAHECSKDERDCFIPIRLHLIASRSLVSCRSGRPGATH